MATSTYPPKLNEGVLQFSVFLSFFVLFILRLAFFVSYYYCAFRRAEENALIFYVCSMCINKNINLYILK